MKWTIKTEMWVSVLIFAVLSVVVFYISFVVKENTLSVSLFGLFFVLIMGALATILDRRIKLKNYSLWVRTVITLVLVNVLMLVIWLPILSRSLPNFLVFSIPYTLVTIIITFIKNNLDSD
ncbi:membrane protease YdiL (CAAX protease family) [Virgibacillus halotolerans]|uniref:hypothetical protein n=1 Tax=Virgibacillus halotolerans TaxID=1071053 RepID=UPI00196159C8|nr:hypothetical protein [Virgibacillus halotolerans]MBM7601093.1 membrane protease YdiL (CAAX protease family) [Virgibacillus halotolerans]